MDLKAEVARKLSQTAGAAAAAGLNLLTSHPVRFKPTPDASLAASKAAAEKQKIALADKIGKYARQKTAEEVAAGSGPSGAGASSAQPGHRPPSAGGPKTPPAGQLEAPPEPAKGQKSGNKANKPVPRKPSQSALDAASGTLSKIRGGAEDAQGAVFAVAATGAFLGKSWEWMSARLAEHHANEAAKEAAKKVKAEEKRELDAAAALLAAVLAPENPKTVITDTGNITHAVHTLETSFDAIMEEITQMPGHSLPAELKVYMREAVQQFLDGVSLYPNFQISRSELDALDDAGLLCLFKTLAETSFATTQSHLQQLEKLKQRCEKQMNETDAVLENPNATPEDRERALAVAKRVSEITTTADNIIKKTVELSNKYGGPLQDNIDKAFDEILPRPAPRATVLKLVEAHVPTLKRICYQGPARAAASVVAPAIASAPAPAVTQGSAPAVALDLDIQRQAVDAVVASIGLRFPAFLDGLMNSTMNENPDVASSSQPALEMSSRVKLVMMTNLATFLNLGIRNALPHLTEEQAGVLVQDINLEPLLRNAQIAASNAAIADDARLKADALKEAQAQLEQTHENALAARERAAQIASAQEKAELVNQHAQEKTELVNQHARQKTALINKKAHEKTDLINQKAHEKAALKHEHVEETAALKREHVEETSALKLRLAEKAREHKSDLEDLKTNLGREKQDALSRLAEQHQTTLDAHQETVNELNGKITEAKTLLDKAIRTADNRAQLSKDSFSSQKQRLEALEKQLQNAQEAKDQITGELASTKAALDVTTGELASTQAAKDVLIGELASTKAQGEDLATRLTAADQARQAADEVREAVEITRRQPHNPFDDQGFLPPMKHGVEYHGTPFEPFNGGTWNRQSIETTPFLRAGVVDDKWMLLGGIEFDFRPALHVFSLPQGDGFHKVQTVKAVFNQVACAYSFGKDAQNTPFTRLQGTFRVDYPFGPKAPQVLIGGGVLMENTDHNPFHVFTDLMSKKKHGFLLVETTPWTFQKTTGFGKFHTGARLDMKGSLAVGLPDFTKIDTITKNGTAGLDTITQNGTAASSSAAGLDTNKILHAITTKGDMLESRLASTKHELLGVIQTTKAGILQKVTTLTEMHETEMEEFRKAQERIKTDIYNHCVPAPSGDHVPKTPAGEWNPDAVFKILSGLLQQMYTPAFVHGLGIGLVGGTIYLTASVIEMKTDNQAIKYVCRTVCYCTACFAGFTVVLVVANVCSNVATQKHVNTKFKWLGALLTNSTAIAQAGPVMSLDGILLNVQQAIFSWGVALWAMSKVFFRPNGSLSYVTICGFLVALAVMIPIRKWVFAWAKASVPQKDLIEVLPDGTNRISWQTHFSTFSAWLETIKKGMKKDPNSLMKKAIFTQSTTQPDLSVKDVIPTTQPDLSVKDVIPPDDSEIV